jgi:fructokinase
MSRVLVIGESLIDVVDRGDGSLPVRHVGGSPLNVAFGLARLGLDTVFATEFGADADGAAITAHLEAAGVRIEQTGDGAARTSTAIARVGSDGSATYDFDLEWNFSRPPRAIEADVVHIGSIGALRLPGAERAVEQLEALPPDVLVTFDPNIRPAVIPPRERTRRLVERYASRAGIVKLSDEDAAWLYPTEHDDAAHLLLERGARIVAVTRGAGGSTVYSAEASVTVPAQSTNAVDTIGAGDAYMSGLIAAVLTGIGPARVADGDFGAADLADIGRVAAVSAGVTVSRAGAMPPTAAELESGLRAAAAAA